ncbi:Vi polysaccharide biosynthesis protein VipA/TviB [Prochlorococcus marinus str. MU1402]|uniref:nucleotide sugar dehydrogenase n=1 Tax=Prochlorococcus marinus TaxID=1219 RepID=UPI001ADC486A|nr:nucleotide sugar dehydrogenase [Prochlorococcus marinus]MBO8232421.1 nucleotide sugar dehydrogenase [Prochlorococcus marinus XMU1402]MBW3057149.1 Vi polysaccharide biosynthesis protein VipA/TviB [Prochlorococcus marinus str. MU1402]
MKYKIAVFGLGYVGLPLLIKLSQFYDVVGFDIDRSRISELKNGKDRTGEIKDKDILKSKSIIYSSHIEDLKLIDIFIVTVPTPVDNVYQPDLKNLRHACSLVGKSLKKNNIVIFESTVYPGATREICVPILEKTSGLKLNEHFGVGYSPERINPGDKKHTIEDIIKITSGSNSETLLIVDQIYKKIISAGTYKVSSIEVAEAAKVIENTQRDINIALINEFSIIFNKLNLSSKEILEAACTKWNFLDFKPGLVGGHCIGIDPYYLTYKSMEIGYKPELILAGRKINDSMSYYVASQFVKLAVKKSLLQKSKKVLVMGVTFKENCKDIRNSKAIEIVNILEEYNLEVDIYDPMLFKNNIKITNKSNLINELKDKRYLGIIIAVAHEEFKSFDIKILRDICIENSIIFDVKNIYPSNLTDLRL